VNITDSRLLPYRHSVPACNDLVSHHPCPPQSLFSVPHLILRLMVTVLSTSLQ
jgi:hypothetical protein